MVDPPPIARAALSAPVRALLDAARACAALYVVAHHVAKAHGWGGPPALALRFGQEAVLVFFLLSGFVIFANERDRALRPWSYAWRRLRRIYPPLLAALAVATVIWWDNGDLARGFDARELVGTLLSLQDLSALKPGVIVDPYLGNDPLWSLSYEMAFYLLFPPLLIAWTSRPRVADHAIGAGACLAYVFYVLAPNHAALMIAYFLVWWVGAMTARAYLEGGRRVRTIGSSYVWLLVLCAMAAAVTLAQGSRGLGVYPVLPLRHFAVAALFVALFFGPIGRLVSRVARPTAGMWASVASVSYGLYVLHVPLLVDWHRARGLFGFTLAAIALVLLSAAIERLLPRLLPAAPRS